MADNHSNLRLDPEIHPWLWAVVVFDASLDLLPFNATATGACPAGKTRNCFDGGNLACCLCAAGLYGSADLVYAAKLDSKLCCWLLCLTASLAQKTSLRSAFGHRISFLLLPLGIPSLFRRNTLLQFCHNAVVLLDSRTVNHSIFVSDRRIV